MGFSFGNRAVRVDTRRGRLIKLAVIMLALLALFCIGRFYTHSNARALSIQPISRRVRQLRAIDYRPNSHVCSKPSEGHVACMAEIINGSNGKPLTGVTAENSGYGPVQFHTAYNLPCTPGGSVSSACSAPSSYGPQTIAIVDAGNYSGGVSGLNISLDDYDSNYNLPACSTTNGCLNVVNQQGSSSSLPGDDGWSEEIALDVETTHMICQTCKIVLVEATLATDTDMAAANLTAVTFDPVSVSNSWGDNVDDTAYDSDFEHSGIAVVAATGDYGSIGEQWPSDIPDVVSAAGTTLQLYSDNTWASESVWSSSGGGCSDYYSAPSWQTSLSNWSTAGCGSYRSFGDISADADPSTGAAINMSGTWYMIGGTSLATPLIASIYALDGGVPSGVIASSVPYESYSTTNFHDITSGDDCTSVETTHCTASLGFDTPSGLGSPNGINGFESLPTQPSNVTATTINQNSISVQWSTSTAGAGLSGYHVYRNGAHIATVSGTSYTDTGLVPNTTYNYTVAAYDTDGNLSLPSSSVSAFTAYPADINEDGHIDLLDLSLLANKYGQCGAGLGRTDINGDGCVNLLDLSILAQTYNSE